MTNVTDQHRRDAITNSLAVYKERGERKTLSIDYRGVDTALEVITIPPELLLLNHDNSRLSAQLFDHPQRAVVEQQPSSDEAQTILGNLLKKTERYGKLKDELKEKQENPGLITREGLLINGNTRVVALRELGAAGVEVAVLPLDALPSDFLDLEMSLQMRRLTHQDYTFTNELLLMEKYKKFGHSDKELGTKMGWFRNWKKKVDKASQLLQLVKEIRVLTTPPLAFDVFDSKSQHLKDLNEQFQAMAAVDIREANRMKWGRVVAMFLGINKDQTRVIDDNFFEEDVLKRLGGDLEVAKLLDGYKKIPSDDNLSTIFPDDGDASEQIDLRDLAKKVISDLSDGEGYVSKDLTDELQQVHTAIRLATEESITKGKREKLLLEPSDVLQETRISIESVVDSFSEVCRLKGFNAGRFEYQLHKVQKSLDDLSKEFKKYVSSK